MTANPELHLFIIWSNAKYKEAEILMDMASRFKILGIHSVTWDKSHFSANLTRFYGENLPPHSNKEKLCGNGPFTLVVVFARMTSKGPQIVNVNLFDSKEMYRHWTGGGHMIHGTNSDTEVRHDLVLLTGYSKKDYLKMTEEAGTTLRESFASMPGEVSWKDMNQLLYVLNETVDYVVLRNFDDLFSNYTNSVHGDVDLLVSNRYLARLALNAKPVHTSKRRVQHVVKIGKGGTYFDIRYLGDDYYCKVWEKKILENRYLTDAGYYRTDDENFAYSLLYHTIVHKKRIAEDYKDTLQVLFHEEDEDRLKISLLKFMKENGYVMNEPYDYTVYFNPSFTGKKMSAIKFINKAWHKVFK